MKLDRKKPFYPVCGEHAGAVHEQNGRLFDSDDEEICDVVEGEPDAPVAPVAKEKPAAKAKAAPVEPVAPASPVDDQIAAQGAA